MKKEDHYIASIRRAYPYLAIEAIQFNAQGQNNDVLLVNGVWMFRFPRYDQALARLRVEMAILSCVRRYGQLEIPEPVFMNLGGRTGNELGAEGAAFVGYRRIPGEPLWQATFASVDDEATVQQLAGELARFLRELHGVPVTEAALAVRDGAHAELPRSDTYEDCTGIYKRVRQELFAEMRPDARRWTENHFETFLGDSANFEYEPVLKHGDFGPSNILCYPGAARVRGIIDFGSSCLGDPAYDFAGLLSGYDEGFVRRCVPAYSALESFLPRVRFYQGTFALLEALFGVECGDERAYRAGMARYV
jgi:aminoglycoside 2''-phosphotransferase